LSTLEVEKTKPFAIDIMNAANLCQIMENSRKNNGIFEKTGGHLELTSFQMKFGI